MKRPIVMLAGLLLGLGSVVHAGTHHHYYTDPQGNVLAKTDAQGNIIATYDYAPYGTAATASGMSGAPNGPGYTGHVDDPESGFVYMQARYYDPDARRFLSVDPMPPKAGNSFTFNRYAYANDNPASYVDPDGKSPMTEMDATKLATSLNVSGSGRSTGFWSVVHPENGPNGYTVQSSEQNAMERAGLTQQAEQGYQPATACSAQCSVGAVVVALTLGDTSDDPSADANNTVKNVAENSSKAAELLQKAPNRNIAHLAEGLKIAPPAVKAMIAIPATKNNYKQCMSECTKAYQDRPTTVKKRED